MPTILQELIEVGMYEALLKDARTVNPNDEKNVDDLLENIETQYRLDVISDEMVKFLTGVLCSRS